MQIEKLGANLNAALARVAVEQGRRAELEARERERLAAEAKDLERYRSEFFGRMREILGEREGVQVVGDRFVFPSEVLFAPGSATLGPGGAGAGGAGRRGDPRDRRPDPARTSTGSCASTAIPTGRRSASTASSPTTGSFREARALSVVRYMVAEQGLPPERLAATGFGEYQPVDPGDSPEALARNRRIELKFTER